MTLQKQRSFDVPALQVQAALVVVLSCAGNPDFNQYAAPAAAQQQACDTITEAAQACRRYISENNLGGGNWTGGQVYHPVKGLIAQISYNGRVWQPTGGHPIGYPVGTAREYPQNRMGLTAAEL